MAAVVRRGGLGGKVSPQARGVPGGRPPGLVLRWIVLLIAAVFFLLPLIVAFRFAGIKAFGSVISEDGFTSSLGLSVRLAIITTVITIVLMLPTTVYVQLA